MYLSNLLIDTGTNPDRPRPGRLWLRNLYRVHQRLCMAFPSKAQTAADPEFLKPYAPAEFARGHVHVQRTAEAGFLFRVDPRSGGRAVVLVLSASMPNWNYAFHAARHLLAGPPQCKPFTPSARPGQQFCFRLLVNAVSRARRQTRYHDGAAIEPAWIGKRIGIPGDEASLRRWLERRASTAGFEIARLTTARGGYVYVNRGAQKEAGQRLRSVLYEGVLHVVDRDKFLHAITCGIGPAKAFGFGLLSIAPAS